MDTREVIEKIASFKSDEKYPIRINEIDCSGHLLPIEECWCTANAAVGQLFDKCELFNYKVVKYVELPNIAGVWLQRKEF